MIVFGAVQDNHRLAAAVARGARGVMLWPDEADHALAGPGSFTAGRPTGRELHILWGFSQGFTHGAIGRELFLSEDTVKTHSRRLLDKLGARDRAHAVALGLRNGVVA